MCLECSSFISIGSKILDLGCGPGIVSKEFEKFFQADLIGVDINDKRLTDINFKKVISGRNLPFRNNSFDVILITYVLHHAKDPIFLLKEASRVLKNNKTSYIIVYEDVFGGFFSKIVCNLHRFFYNKCYNLKGKGIFKTEEKWLDLFKQLGLEVVSKKRVSVPLAIFYPVGRRQFVIRKRRV